MAGKSKKKKLPRNRRVPPGERPPMRLTARDCAIIKMVNDCRVLFGRHIQALFFGSQSTAQYRLSRLYHHEFLARHFIPVVSGGPASSPTLYTIDKRGAQVLVDRFDYGPEAIRLPKKSTLAWQFLEHLLKINDVRVAITLAVRAQGWELVTWQDELVFRADPDYVQITSRSGKAKQQPVLPDGYFHLVVPQGNAHFFLEVDQGTEPHSRFRPQIEIYQAYTASGQYQTRYGTKSLRVLVVTASSRRLANLKRMVEEMGGDRKYWFTTLEQVTPETVLTANIWQVIGRPAPQRLIAHE